MQRLQVLALGGDGVGPEVLAAGLQVAEVAAVHAGVELSVERDLLHGAAWERYGCFCRDETVAAAQAADAVLVGAVGGPAWDHIVPAGGPQAQDGLMRLRKSLDTYLGLRPARDWPALADRSPFAPGRAEHADLVVVREMCGGVMFAPPRGQGTREGTRFAYDTAAYDEVEIARIARAAFELARTRRGRVVSADKANVMESYKLWRTVVSEVATDYPDVTLTHLYADNCAYQMMMDPVQFDVVLGCNLLGDLLSDLAAAVSGGLGLLPSACLAGAPHSGAPGIYEPVHGSAPDIAGTGQANPIGMILSVALLFEHTAMQAETAARIEDAVEQVLNAGLRTPDLGGSASTQDMTHAVIAAFSGHSV